MKRAELADIPRIVGMGRRFWQKYPPRWGFDAVSVAGFFQDLIESPDGLLLVSDKGFAAAVVQRSPFDPQWLVAAELMMWSEDGQGGRFWRAMRRWAKEKGANEFQFSCHVHNDRVRRFMEKAGRADQIVFSEVI